MLLRKEFTISLGKLETSIYVLIRMKKLQSIEQELLKLSPSETKRLLAWIDRYLEDKTEEKEQLHPAIHQSKRHLAQARPRVSQP